MEHVNVCVFSTGLIPSSVQSCSLHPPAMVFHHHIQCGQTPDEEQTTGEGEFEDTDYNMHVTRLS